jgi:lysophospholipase L1-like esterase
MSNSLFVRGAAALVLLGTIAACSDENAKVVGPTPANNIFASYVAIGNSITAGFQSAGIMDSTQKRAYPVLLAGQMRTRFAYQSLKNPGCPPPVNNFQTQSRVTITGQPPSTSNTCALDSLSTDILNSVAVPGATSLDPTSATTSASNLLTTLILGGQTQVDKALKAKPTFATIWIGNNDVLAAALSGVLVPTPNVSPGVTPTTNFVANYAKMVNQLIAGAPTVKGAMVGVVQVTGAPVLFSAQLLLNAQFLGGLSVAAGKTITVDPTTCTPTTTSLISFLIISAIRANQHPPVIACEKTATPPLGDIFVLDAGEIASLTATITAYNTYIHAKADSVGFAYVDPNPLLAQLRASGAILSVPNLASTTAPFGTAVSIDGVHPSNSTHVLIANSLIDAINAKFSTSLVKLP